MSPLDSGMGTDKQQWWFVIYKQAWLSTRSHGRSPAKSHVGSRDMLEESTVQFHSIRQSHVTHPSQTDKLSRLSCVTQVWWRIYQRKCQNFTNFPLYTPILYNFIQFVSHASHTSLKLTNCHACPASHRSGDEFTSENVKTSQFFL